MSHTSLDERRAAMKRRRALPELDRRREAAQATRDKFEGVPLDWAKGMHCLKMVHFHLRQMGWRSPKLPTLPSVRSPLAAHRALKERGWSDLSEMLDALLVRIPPAMMRLGDVAAQPGDQGFDSLMVNIGPRGFLAWLPDGSAARVMVDCDMTALTGAWRV